MKLESYNSFLLLVQLGLGNLLNDQVHVVDWQEIRNLAMRQGLLDIVLDGIETLPEESRPTKEFLLDWIGVVMQDESRFTQHNKASSEMALLFHNNCIKTYVLKGAIVAECYPRPEHRVSSDMDCFLLPDKGDFDAWALGNDLIRAKGFETNTDFYKNSAFYLPGLIVENHKFLTPFRGNRRMREFEIVLQVLLKNDTGEDRFEGTWLYRPPVMVSALFLIEHAYSHFLHEGLTWRHVLDWMMFSKKHNEKINWFEFEALVDEYGFRKFYDSYSKLGKYLLGDIEETELGRKEKRMLADVWADLDLHETLHGVKGKIGLVGNTLRARWKYRDFAEISMLQALWIQVKGYLFDKHPTID